MDPEGRKILTAVRRQQELRAGTGTRYPTELRQRALAYAAAHEHLGEGLGSISRRLGLSPQLLLSWRKREPLMMVRPVEIRQTDHVLVDGSGSCGPVVVAAGGLRVEGLSVPQLAQLLRELS